MGVDDDRLMNVVSESVKLVMEEVSSLTIRSNLMPPYLISFKSLEKSFFDTLVYV